MSKKIGIFATSNPLHKEKKPQNYAFLKSKGFEIYESENVRRRIGHTAGSIEERVSALHNLLKDNSIDILMAYWGGANTNQLLPHLDYNLFKEKNKKIIGFSDTSALLLAVNKLAGITTYLGPAGISFDKPEPFEYTFDYFKRFLVDEEENILIKDSSEYADDLYFLRQDSDHRIIQKNTGRKIFRHGKTEGIAIASNLQTLLVLAGTLYFPNLKDKILFIEEDENTDTAMIHRFFTHLSQTINLNILKGICIGRFMYQSGFSEKDSQEMIFQDVFDNLNIPIIYNLNFGHSDPLFTIPIGERVRIDTKKNILEFIKN
ncbi:MAG: S66 peptidase family protein [Patescibacteria group bacterium]